MQRKNMLKKISLFSIALGVLFLVPRSHAETKTTTVEETTTQTTTPRTHKAAGTTTTSNTRVTTTRESAPRQILTEDTLKKISNTLCTKGFRAYVGNDRRNICQGMSTSPDLSYSCVWEKRGAAVYASTEQGPCSLDYVEHRGSIIITRDEYVSRPPLKYGVEAQCCYRAAKGSLATN